MRHWINALNRLLEHPVKVAIVVALIGFSSLIYEGTLFNLWNLKREITSLHERFERTVKQSADLNFRIEQAKSSDKFIGRQARDRLDLLKEDEIVFIFENDNTLETQAN